MKFLVFRKSLRELFHLFPCNLPRYSQILAGILEFSSISLCLGVLCLGVLCLGLFWDSCLGKRAWEGSGLRGLLPEVSQVRFRVTRLTIGRPSEISWKHQLTCTERLRAAETGSDKLVIVVRWECPLCDLSIKYPPGGYESSTTP